MFILCMRFQNQKWFSSVCYITLYVLDALRITWHRSLSLVLVVDTYLC